MPYLEHKGKIKEAWCRKALRWENRENMTKNKIWKIKGTLNTLKKRLEIVGLVEIFRKQSENQESVT